MAKQTVYEKVAEQILTALENGVRPWDQCYSVSKRCFPIRSTGDEYRGINRFLLLFSMHNSGFSSPMFMTFNQARKLGGSVRKGEKASLSLFYSTLEIEEEGRDDKKMIPYAKQNNVFNVDQIDGLPEGFMEKFVTKPVFNDDLEPCERAERFIQNVPAVINEKDCVPCFRPALDLVNMPKIGQFKTVEHYYATAMHELTHWTGHPKRLHRFEADKAQNEKDYAFEELVAEIGASFLLPAMGIEPLIDEEHAPYISHYIKLLNDDPKAFISACSKAEKAADLLKSFQTV
jgi:antirestriction protein ArdC